MKKRVLKKWLENALIKINIVLFIVLVCVTDFTFKGFFVLVGMMMLIFVNCHVLEKYGRNKKFEE